MQLKNNLNKNSKSIKNIMAGLIMLFAITAIVLLAHLFMQEKKIVHSKQASTYSSAKSRPFSAKTYRLVQSKRCAGCHGTKGQGRFSVTAPPLAGQSADTLKEKIKAYRSGKNANPAMRLMTKDLTDDEITQLAEYYSQFQVIEPAPAKARTR